MHTPGVNNIADAISRFQVAKFQQLFPMASDTIPTWSLQSFSNASYSALIMALSLQQDAPTSQASQNINNSVINMASHHCQHPH